MANLDVAHFTAVDHTSDPGFFLRFLDAVEAIPGVSDWKLVILDALRLSPGMKVLDVGSGMGTDAFQLAQRVGPKGHVTAVDFSESLVNEANRRAASKNLPATFEVGDAQHLRFPNESFDAVRAERLLMHVPDAEKALLEMVRVLRRGGRMAVLDFDWEGQFCDSPYKETTRKIMLSFCDGLKNGWIGRSLPRMFRQSGMSDVTVNFRTVLFDYDFLQLLLGGHVARMVATGAITDWEANRWWTDLARAHARGVLHSGLTASIVSGTRA